MDCLLDAMEFPQFYLAEPPSEGQGIVPPVLEASASVQDGCHLLNFQPYIRLVS